MPKHEKNDWGIELVETPEEDKKRAEPEKKVVVETKEGESVENLMAELNMIQQK